MRLIPKKSKVNSTIWLNFTLMDIILAFALFLFAVLIALSNFKYKWIMLMTFVSLSVMMFFSDGDERAYKDLINMVKYAVSRKRYEKDGKKNNSYDLIPFKKINADGIIEYDGYFGAVISVGSIEFGLLDESEQDRRVSIFASTINSLGENSELQLVKIDRAINYDDVAKGLFEKLQDERNRSPRNSAKIAILESRLKQIDDLNNLAKQYRPFYYLVVYDNIKENLYRQIDVMLRGLDKAGMPAKFIDAKETAVFFKYCYTRNFDEREIEDISPENYTDWIKPASIRFNSSSYTSDGTYTFTCAISDYPLAVANAWGNRLFNIDNTKVVMTIRPVEKTKAVKRIDRAVVELQTRRGSGKISEAISQETHVQTMANLAQTIQNENELLFDCTIIVTAFNNTQEKNSIFRKEIRRQIMTDAFKVNFLRGRQFDGFASATVSRNNKLKSFARGINSESLASVFPFVFTSIIEPNGMTIGYDYYPVVLDIWKRDNKQYINSNMIVLGKSGSGKSFFTKTLLSLLFSENSRIYILDPENEYATLCRNVGGRFIDVGNATEGRINPLHIYQVMTEDGTSAPPEVVFSAHLQFLESFFKITLAGITSDSLEELNNILVKVYKDKSIDETTDCSGFSADKYPTFDDLLKTVEKEIVQEKVQARKANLERIRTYVAKFAKNGRFSTLWNGESTLTSNEDFVVFNFQSLLSSKNNVVANAQMLVIMRYLNQQIINIREMNRNGNMIHPVIAIDEGYALIDEQNPIGLDFIFMWYKRIRKYNGTIMFLTQNLSDILGNQAIVSKTTAIINNAQYSFIFSLAPADITILMDLYKTAGGINETERSQIANAGNGECFAICSAQERTSFKVVASNVVYTIFNHNDALKLIESGNVQSPFNR